MYLHPLPPPPHSVDFSATLISTSSSSVSPVHLSRTTQLRENVRSILANPSGTVVEVKLVQAIEDYLPCLIAIFNCCQTDQVVWKRDAWFVWYPLLSPHAKDSTSSATSGSPPYASTSILFELDHVLILYSLALSNLATLQYVSVGSYEFERTLSEADRKQKDVILKRGVAFSQKAIGVVRWLLQDLSVTDENQDSQEWGQTRRRLLEGLVALHQLPPTLISLRLLMSQSTSTIQSSGQLPPPIPKGHPSPSLLAKLYLEVPRLADEAGVNLAAAAGQDITGQQQSSSSSNIRKFLSPSSAGTSSSSGGKLTSKFKGLGLGRSSPSKQHGDDLHRSASHGQEDITGSPSQSPLAPPGTSPSPPHVPLSNSLLLYLTCLPHLYKATAFLYLGLASGESTDSSSDAAHHGEAIVWLQMALGQLNVILDDTRKLDDLVGKPERVRMERHYSKKPTTEGNKDRSWQMKTEKRQQDQQQQSEPQLPSKGTTHHPLHHRLQSHTTHIIRSLHLSITHTSQVYTRLNDSISFQRLPSQQDMYTKIPTPRAVLSGNDSARGEWKCPRPQFGPGSESESSEDQPGPGREDANSQWGLINGQHAGDDEQRDGYVGKGAYY